MTKDQDLARCKGYRVETHDGGIGGVAAVLPRAGRQKRGVLLVHTGLLSCGLYAIPFDEVETIDPGERRVLLRGLSRTTREGAPSRARDRIVSRASPDEAGACAAQPRGRALATRRGSARSWAPTPMW